MRKSLVDLERGIVTDATDDGSSPVWTPDGDRLVLASWRADRLLTMPADGSAQPRTLYEEKPGATVFNNGSWSPDGRVLVYSQGIGPDGIVALSTDESSPSARRLFEVPREANVA